MTASCLDYKRLGKQRVEAFQILKSIQSIKNGSKYGWQNHPATKMWLKYPNALKEYYNTILQEWINRGYNNSMPFKRIHGKIKYPHWLGNRKFHSLHRANLLRKDYEYYSLFEWKEKPSNKYYWPI